MKKNVRNLDNKLILKSSHSNRGQGKNISAVVEEIVLVVNRFLFVPVGHYILYKSTTIIEIHL